MRFDLISIFPQYFAPLELSLLGKAQQTGQVQIFSHDLRDWAEGRHRSVDDAPVGGGAGMVMRANVWGNALDQVLQEGGGGRQVVAIPTPAGRPLDQRLAEELTGADQIIVACGRYEGIDGRVTEHYRDAGMEVLEFSIGDYVLNGGEVAALVLVEAVGRLLDGVVGNPDSLVEESHAEDGLLEYPVYTHPREWRGLSVPEVLRGGNHALITRWRRDQGLRRTVQNRPDLLHKLDSAYFDREDRRTLASAGWLLTPRPTTVQFREAVPEEAAALAALAARTFPDACPPGFPEADMLAFLAENLSEQAFGKYLADPDYLVTVAEVGQGDLVAYTLVGRIAPGDLGRVPLGSAYLSKCYTDSEYRGSGVTAALVDDAVALTRRTWDPPAIGLATNRYNRRAAKFYRRLGFRPAGRRYFLVGETNNVDDVFVADFTAAK